MYSLFQNVIPEVIFDFQREIGVFYKIWNDVCVKCFERVVSNFYVKCFIACVINDLMID